MATLIVVGIVSGIITAISPCVLPVLPAILTSSVQDGASNRRRPIVVVAGLVTSFAFFTLLGGVLLSSLGLPDDVLRWTGIVILALVGLGLAVPAVGHVLERPFRNTRMPQLNRDGNGVVMGLALGLVFVPCAGPILASITVLAATKGLSWGLVALTVSFSLGVAVPLLVFGLAGQAIGSRVSVVRERLQAIRIASGVVLIATAVVIAANVAEPLQRIVPEFVASIQERIENNDAVRSELDTLTGREDADPAVGTALTFDQCNDAPADELQNCGPARDLVGITSWLNIEGGQTLDLDELRGQVVLIDFWTYSCINCQRTFPYITAWHERYGIDYPIALDNDFATWQEWDQRFWPAHYLIDQAGIVRQVHYGEGEYAETELLIQQLLDAPPQDFVEAEDVDHTQGRTRELYVGHSRLAFADNGEFPTEEPVDFTATEVPERDHFSFGGEWTVRPEHAVAGEDAHMNLSFYAKDVHLVLAGEGQVRVTLAEDPRFERVVEVDGTSDLYDLYEGEPIEGTESPVTGHLGPIQPQEAP